MTFPFGIEKEAEIYCKSAKFAMALQASDIESQIADMANNMKINGTIGLPYTTVLNYMVSWTEDAVIKSGWNLIDEDGVSWWIGLFTQSYIRATDDYPHSFDEIFTQVFIRYFNNK